MFQKKFQIYSAAGWVIMHYFQYCNNIGHIYTLQDLQFANLVYMVGNKYHRSSSRDHSSTPRNIYQRRVEAI